MSDWLHILAVVRCNIASLMGRVFQEACGIAVDNPCRYDFLSAILYRLGNLTDIAGNVIPFLSWCRISTDERSPCPRAQVFAFCLIVWRGILEKTVKVALYAQVELLPVTRREVKLGLGLGTFAVCTDFFSWNPCQRCRGYCRWQEGRSNWA